MMDFIAGYWWVLLAVIAMLGWLALGSKGRRRP